MTTSASSKQQAASSKQQGSVDPPPYPIQLSIGYGWKEHNCEGSRLNPHWDFLRKEVQPVAKELEERAAKRTSTQHPLRISLGRLRGRHGTSLMGGIFRRIERADVLIFDISGHNSNVLFELGYAMAQKGADSGRIYVFGQKGIVPADLSGLMLTYYEVIKKTGGKSEGFAKLEDPRGFRAALRSTLIEIAQERGMWGLSKQTVEDEEI